MSLARKVKKTQKTQIFPFADSFWTNFHDTNSSAVSFCPKRSIKLLSNLDGTTMSDHDGGSDVFPVTHKRLPGFVGHI